ncbi:MAG: hypothetical protein J7M18_06550, partial [Candidatus Eremiobacteraeota bacterium]|nr:hypothetical protein [Candidatus Eremiobacteraeota bacterium]
LITVEPMFLSMQLPAPWWKYEEFEGLQFLHGYRPRGEDRPATTLKIIRRNEEPLDLIFKWKKDVRPYFDMVPVPDDPGKYVLEIEPRAWKKFRGKVETTLEIFDKIAQKSVFVNLNLNFMRAELLAPESVKLSVKEAGPQMENSFEIRRKDRGKSNFEFKWDIPALNEHISLCRTEDDPNRFYLMVNPEAIDLYGPKLDVNLIAKDNVGGEEARIHFSMIFESALVEKAKGAARASIWTKISSMPKKQSVAFFLGVIICLTALLAMAGWLYWQNEPARVVNRYYNALKKKDIRRAFDFVYFYGEGPTQSQLENIDTFIKRVYDNPRLKVQLDDYKIAGMTTHSDGRVEVKVIELSRLYSSRLMERENTFVLRKDHNIWKIDPAHTGFVLTPDTIPSLDNIYFLLKQFRDVGIGTLNLGKFYSNPLLRVHLSRIIPMEEQEKTGK